MADNTMEPETAVTVEQLRAQLAAMEADRDRAQQQVTQLNANFHLELAERLRDERLDRLERLATAHPIQPQKLKVEVAKPNDFDGSEVKFDSFLHQMELLFWGSPTHFGDDNNRITSALSYMRGGRAEPWARNYMERHRNEQAYTETWSQFKDLLKASFGASDPTLHAVDKIRKLEQGSLTADEYIVAFEEHESYTGWDEKALIDQFEKGLKPGLQASVYRLESMPTTLQGWKSYVRKFDRQWRMYEEKQRTSRTHTGSKTSTTKSTVIVKESPGSQHVSSPAGSTARKDYSGTVFGGQGQPMDVDRHQSRTRCWQCGNSGHVAKYCPEKLRGNVQQVRQVLSYDERTELLHLLQQEQEERQSQSFHPESQ